MCLEKKIIISWDQGVSTVDKELALIIDNLGLSLGTPFGTSAPQGLISEHKAIHEQAGCAPPKKLTIYS